MKLDGKPAEGNRLSFRILPSKGRLSFSLIEIMLHLKMLLLDKLPAKVTLRSKKAENIWA